MKKRILTLLALVLLLLPAGVLAEKARFYRQDNNRTYHSQHLAAHVGSANCRVSGNYITVRSGRGSGSTVGHVEQADAFRLEEVSGHYARITVTYSASTSPKSWVGLSGWVNADYVECPCSSGEYYGGNARRTYSLGTVASGGTHLRELASGRSRSLGTIPGGASVEVLAEYDGGFYRVRWGSRVGFAASGKVSITATGLTEGGALPGPSAGGWRQGYRDFLTQNHASLGAAAVYDMDRDGTPELIVHNGDDSMAGAACLVYTWTGGTLYYLGDAGFRECILTYYPGSAYSGLFCFDGNMGVYTTRYYARMGYTVASFDVLEEDHTLGGTVDWTDNPRYSALTTETALVDLVRTGTPRTLSMATWQEIQNMGWDAFLQP